MSAVQIGAINSSSSSNSNQPTAVPVPRASSVPAQPVHPGGATDITTRAVSASGAAPGTTELRDAIKKIEAELAAKSSDLRFSIDEDTGITVIKLIDTQTDTVLRQIPTVEVLEISKALDKLQGLLVKEKA